MCTTKEMIGAVKLLSFHGVLFQWVGVILFGASGNKISETKSF
jgi:hypothetical protein